RRPAAGNLLGADARRRPLVHDGRVVADGDARPRHPLHRPQPQHHGRLAAGSTRPPAADRMMAEPILEVQSLCTHLPTKRGLVRATAPQSGRILFGGEARLAKSREEMRAIRGKDITMVLQNPMTALDPVYTVGNQLREILRFNADMTPGERTRRAIEMLRQVHIPSPEERLENYPHQMSGGMKQRVLTAMATGLKPGLLLADEPTTALDVTIQEQILG